MLLASLVMIPTVWLPDLTALSFLGVCGLMASTSVGLLVSACGDRGRGACGPIRLIS